MIDARSPSLRTVTRPYCCAVSIYSLLWGAGAEGFACSPCSYRSAAFPIATLVATAFLSIFVVLLLVALYFLSKRTALSASGEVGPDLVSLARNLSPDLMFRVSAHFRCRFSFWLSVFFEIMGPASNTPHLEVLCLTKESVECDSLCGRLNIRNSF